MENVLSQKTKYLIKVVLVTAAVYLSVKYMLPLMLPLILAYILKRLIVPVVSFLNKKLGLNKKVMTAVFLILITTAIAAVIGIFMVTASKQIKNLIKNSGNYKETVDNIADNTCDIVEKYSGIDSDEIRIYMDKNVDRIFDIEQNSDIMYKVMGKSVNIVVFIGKCVVILFTALIGAYYMSVTEKMQSVQEKEKYTVEKNGENSREENEKGDKKGDRKSDGDNGQGDLSGEIKRVAGRTMSACMEYVKTQLIIMLVTFFICLICFLVIGNDYAVIVALVVGMLDALPLIGVGTILVPWGVVYILMGKYFKAAVILVTFLICYMFREICEPKLMGDRMGISPVESIMAMYIGFSLFGITGVITGPVSYIIIRTMLRPDWQQEEVTK